MLFLLAVFLNVSYGADARQRFDVYTPERAHHAPIIVMVHGGGWRIGDKSVPRMYENKVNYWVPKGYVFVSVNYRMLPDADPLEQARDVAHAIAKIEETAATWGGDRTNVILMGHSAGAHLIALVTTSAQLAPELRGATWNGVVLLDSGALDVPQIMRRPHFRLYDDAFGSDPQFWRTVSPFHELTKRSPPLLAVCSTRRPDSCPQASAFVAKATSLGTKARVLEENLSHEQINETLGEKSAYTEAVDGFIGEVTRRNIHISADAPRTMHVEPWLAINPTNPRNLIASAVALGEQQGCVIYASRDAGLSWQRATYGSPPQTVFGDIDPHIVFAPDGVAFFASISPFRVWMSTDGGLTWSIRSDVPGRSYDREFLAASASSLYAAGKFPITVLGHEGGDVIAVSRSTDGGKSFLFPKLILPDPATLVLQIVSDLAVLAGERLLLVYEVFAWPKPGEDKLHGEYFTMLFDASLRLIAGPTRITHFTSIGHADEQKSMMGTGGGRLAVDANGAHLYFTWLDLVDDSFQVFLSRSDDLGRTWTAPVRVSDSAGHDAANPGVAIEPGGSVGVVWNDRRADPHGLCFQPYFASSADRGATFGANVALFDGLTCPTAQRFLSGGDTIGIVGTPDGFLVATIAAKDGVLQLWSTAITTSLSSR